MTNARKFRQATITALAALSFLALWLHAEPSHTAIPDLEQPRADFALGWARSDLSRFVTGRTDAVSRFGGVVSAADLAAALAPEGGSRHPIFMLGSLRSPGLPSDPRSEMVAAFLGHLPYGSILVSTAERNGVDGLLLAAIVEAESGFLCDAVSPEGAVGLMQILPSTGAHYGIPVRELAEPSANLDAGSRFLKELLQRFGGDPELAVAAYNAGPEVVARYHRVPPYPETRDFVRKVLALYRSHCDTVVKQLQATALLAGRARDHRTGVG